MEIIIKYSFEHYSDELIPDKDEVIEAVKQQLPNDLALTDTDGDTMFSDDDEPEVEVSDETTLITTCDGKQSVQFNLGHIETMQGLVSMYKKD